MRISSRPDIISSILIDLLKPQLLEHASSSSSFSSSSSEVVVVVVVVAAVVVVVAVAVVVVAVVVVVVVVVVVSTLPTRCAVLVGFAVRPDEDGTTRLNVLTAA